jgi:3-deoxy-manno-octulosonate cytidylyltransferase (CMP-KDO synthetase)
VKSGHVILTPLAPAGGQVKPQPALVLHRWEPAGHLLVCPLSPQLQDFVPGLDDIIRRSDPDFQSSGLPNDSVVRVGCLATVPAGLVQGEIGCVSQTRLRQLRLRLASVFQPALPRVRSVVGLIPARYASTRFPGKPLHPIAGKPLLQHVVERCRLAKTLSEVIVATDDERIREAAEPFCRVEMTRADHPSGTDRIAEVAARCECDAVVNIQGDEPLIEPAVIDAVAAALDDHEMATAATPIRDAAEYDNPNVVKVVVSAAGRALYFSRRTIPYLREAASRPVAEQLAAFAFLKHLGIYGYRRETLLRLVRLPVSPLEQAEKLEQLRALENGFALAVVQVEHDSVGVDAPADVERVARLLAARRGGSGSL